jgi:tetratricopeptide (TPR) repeat protein
MKKLLFILFVVLGPGSLFSQIMLPGIKRDSLLEQLSVVRQDTQRVKLLYELTELLTDSEWIPYNEQLIELTKKKSEAARENDPLKKFYLRYYAKGLENKGVDAYEKGNTAAAQLLFKQSRDIYIQLGDKEAFALSAYHMGSVFLVQGSMDEATACFKQCLQISSDKETISNCLNNLGVIYDKRGDSYTALDCYHKSLKIRTALEDQAGIASSLSNIGIIYFNQDELEKASDYFQKSLQLQQKLHDNRSIAICFHNLSGIYLKQENIPKAVEYGLTSLAIRRGIGDKKGMVTSYNNLAVLCGRQNNLDGAMAFARDALVLEQELSDKTDMPVTLYIIGNVYKKQGKLQKASGYIQQSLALSRELGLPARIRDAAELLKDIYTQQHKDKEALGMYDLFIRMRDSVQNEETKKAAIEKQYQYEFERKESTLKKEQEQKDFLREETIRKKNYLVYGVSIIALLSIVIAFLIVRQERLHTRQQTLELEQKLLRTQMNPHFIFNVFNSIQSYIYKKDSINAGVYMSRFAELTRMILENSRHNYISLEQEIKGLEHYLQLQQLRFEDRFEYSIETGPQIDTASIAIPPMLAQPFIENALEHGIRDYQGTKGRIAVRFYLEENNLVMEIEDNGIGIEKSKAQKQQADSQHKSLATTITAERILVLNRQISGKIRMHITNLQTPDNSRSGTKVVFQIPYQTL